MGEQDVADLLTAQTYFPPKVQFTCCPTCEGFNPDNWTQSAEGRATIEHEALILITFLQRGRLELKCPQRLH